MCGIAGLLSLAEAARVEAGELEQMAAPLQHRGPDQQCLYLDPLRRCGLAFRRLAIIDLHTGQQPMPNEDRSIWVIFNGEIYNYRELRDELIARGHRFSSQADSEVIVHAYEQWGAEFLPRLAGMFAIALWDQPRARLLLARDRLGKKPLCFARLGDRLAFASELKAILALRGAPRQVDHDALHGYLLFQYVRAPHSIYHGYQKLPPGTFVEFEAFGQADTTPRAFWRVPTPTRFAGTYIEAQQRLGELLRAAVEKRLIADVALGAFLSGGVDSSIVVGLMRELGVAPLRTFSVGFADPRYDESQYARRVAAHFQTQHSEQCVTPQAQEMLAQLVHYYDEPFADSSAIPTLYVARHTRSQVTVALTGDGGDECFAGYDRYRALHCLARLERLPAPLRRGLAAASGWLPHARPKSLGSRLHRLLSPLALPPERRYLSWVNVFTPAQLAAGYRDDFRTRLDAHAPLRWFDELFAAAGQSGPHAAAWVDLHSYLPFDLLTKVDIAAMAHSLECRSPFLDHELLTFALSLPIEWRIGKRILKEWARPLLPEFVLSRAKMGFGVPIGEWFRRELRTLLSERLLASSSVSRRIFQEAWLRRLLQEHLDERANHEHRLWSLLILELWNEHWTPSWG